MKLNVTLPTNKDLTLQQVWNGWKDWFGDDMKRMSKPAKWAEYRLILFVRDADVSGADLAAVRAAEDLITCTRAFGYRGQTREEWRDCYRRSRVLQHKLRALDRGDVDLCVVCLTSDAEIEPNTGMCPTCLDRQNVRNMMETVMRQQ